MRSGLITDEAGMFYMIGQWLRDAADRLAQRVMTGEMSRDEAADIMIRRAHLITTNSGFPSNLPSRAAERSLEDAITRIAAQEQKVLDQMIDAARRILDKNPRAKGVAADVCATIARDARVAPELIHSAMRIALWQRRRA